MKSNPIILLGVLTFIGQLSNYGIGAETHPHLGDESKPYELEDKDEKVKEVPEEIYLFRSTAQNDKVIEKREAFAPKNYDFDPDTRFVKHKKTDQLANAFVKSFEQNAHKLEKIAGTIARNAEGFTKDITNRAKNFGKHLPDFVPNVDPNNFNGFKKKTVRTEGTEETKIYRNKYGPHVYETWVHEVQPPRDKSIITKTSPELNITIISDVPADTSFGEIDYREGFIYSNHNHEHGFTEETVNKNQNTHGKSKSNAFNSDSNIKQRNEYDNRTGNDNRHNPRNSNEKNTQTIHEQQDRFPEDHVTPNNEERGNVIRTWNNVDRDIHVNLDIYSYNPNQNYNPINYQGNNMNTRSHTSRPPSREVTVHGGYSSVTSNSANFNTNLQDYNATTVKPYYNGYDTTIESNQGRTNTYSENNFNSYSQNYNPTVKSYSDRHDTNLESNRGRTYKETAGPINNLNNFHKNGYQLLRNVENFVASRDDGVYVNIVNGNTRQTVQYPNYNIATSTTYIPGSSLNQHGTANIGFRAFNNGYGSPNNGYGSPYNGYGSPYNGYGSSYNGFSSSGIDHETSSNQRGTSRNFQESPSNLNTGTYIKPYSTFDYIALPIYYPKLQTPYQGQFYAVPNTSPTQSYIVGEYLNRNKRSYRSNVYDELQQEIADARKDLTDASRHIKRVSKKHSRHHKNRRNYSDASDEYEDDDYGYININNGANNIYNTANSYNNYSNRNNGNNNRYNNYNNRANRLNTNERSGNYMLSPENNYNSQTREHNDDNKENNPKSEIETNFQILQPNANVSNFKSHDTNVNNFKTNDNNVVNFEPNDTNVNFQSPYINNITNSLTNNFITLNKTDFSVTTPRMLEDQIIKKR